MPTTDYAKNLRLLCDEHGTVSDVCRGIEINRQQFNKYLSGQITPNRHNRRRICEFFHVDDEQMNASHDEFAELLHSPEQDKKPAGLSDFFAQMVESLPNEVDKLRGYTGYYYQWFHSLGFDGYIIKALISIYERDGVIYSKTVEHLNDGNDGISDSYVFKYRGTVFYLSDRIFLLEYETLTKRAFNLTILNSSYRSKITSLNGITIGVSSRATREPSACRVEWEYLGKNIDVRDALKSCQLYKHDSPNVDPALKARISNHIGADKFLLQGVMD